MWESLLLTISLQHIHIRDTTNWRIRSLSTFHPCEDDFLSSLSPSQFFDLTSFSHSALFRDEEPVWSALERLLPYLEGLTPSIDVSLPEGVYLAHKQLISIEEGVVVEPGAFISGPCWIGKGSVIRHGAYIRGGVITGEACVIGHATEIKNSVLLNGAKAPHFAYVGDSLLGNGTNLGAGTRLANLKLKKDEVKVEIAGKRVSTGRRKLGAIVGDGAQTGCNSVCSPGTFLGRGALLFPCVHVGGWIEEGAVIRPKR